MESRAVKNQKDLIGRRTEINRRGDEAVAAPDRIARWVRSSAFHTDASLAALVTIVGGCVENVAVEFGGAFDGVSISFVGLFIGIAKIRSEAD